MPTGRITRYEGKGWGFIRPDGGGRDVFMHLCDVRQSEQEAVAQGVPVTYEVVQSERGPRAVRIRVVPKWEVPAKSLPEGDGDCDVLTAAELEAELRTALNRLTDALVDELVALARRHGWVE